jgi:hypothetical protein
MTEEIPSGIDPADRPLTRLMSSALLMHAVAALVELGVVEELADGPRSAADVARNVHASERGLTVVLRAGAAAGMVAEPLPGRFALTAAGRRLRVDEPGSRRDLVRMYTDGAFLPAWSRLAPAVRAGVSAIEVHTGRPLFTYLEERPDAAALFNTAMDGSIAVEPVLRNIDLSGTERVVDVGGGEGALLAAVLSRHPEAEGVLFDLPHVVATAAPLLRERGVADRCTVVGGSFFDRVPPGADVYLVARVMQNWPDEEAVRILRTLREAMHHSSRLLIIGHLPGPDGASPFIQAMSLYMFVLYGAPLRTVAEYDDLFARAGLALHRVHRVDDAESTLEVRRA